MSEDPKNTANGEVVEVPIAWHYPEGQAATFANHMVVQHDDHEFHLSFFEIKPPLTFAGDEATVKGLKSIPAECVARIVVAKGRMKQFIEALQSNFERSTSEEKAVARIRARPSGETKCQSQ